jgi:hypothetical protein
MEVGFGLNNPIRCIALPDEKDLAQSEQAQKLP